MDHLTRVWNATQFLPVDRPPFDMFDEAGFLFDDAGRYDPAQRLRLSLDQQVAARIRFHQEFDTDLIFDAPVLAEGCVPHIVRLAPAYADRYDLKWARFPVTAAMWQPWPPQIEPRPGINPRADDRIELVAEWQNGLATTFMVELASGTMTGFDVLVRDRDEWPSWQEALTPRLAAFDYSYLERIRQATGGDVALYGTIGASYGLYPSLFGTEQAIYYLYDDPQFACAILDWQTEVAIEVGRDIRHGVKLLRLGEAGCSLLNPALYQQYVQPRHRRMHEALAAAGGVPITHICGRCSALLEAIANAHTVGLETLTPRPLGDADLADAKRRIGDRVVLKGNLDPVHVVCAPTPQEVATATRQCLEVGTPGSGYILSVADCLVPGTPLANVQAIADTVHAWRGGAGAK